MREPFSINPMLAEHIAPLTEDELRLLEESLLAEGCRDPLVVWREENVLVDGHNRKAICDKQGLSYSVVYRSFRDVDAAKAWMDLNQLGRRNLSKDQRNELIRRLAANGVRQKDIAEKVGVSQGRISQISKEVLETNKHQPSQTDDLTVTQKHKEEKARLQKELDQARFEKIETEGFLKTAQNQLEHLKQRERERAKQQTKTIEKEVVKEKEIKVENPETLRKLNEAEAKLKKIESDKKTILQLEEKKIDLEAELKTLRMKARDEKAELTLYEAIDTIERVTFIRDRVHDLCNRNQLTVQQLDKTETVLENLSVAIKEALVVVRASRGALTKEGGLRIVE